MSSINTYFSQRDNLQKVIIENIEASNHHLMIAVAWFTDSKLFNTVLEKQLEGVKVELIITKHQFNDESINDYQKISNNGGIFLEIGGDYSTMHHKFCIVDHHILLQGSFNWTRKANESNNETLLVIHDDPQAINEFTGEFERLKRFAGFEEEVHDLVIAKALQYFDLIKALIKIGKTSELNIYIHELKNISELNNLVDLLFRGEYDNAVKEMELLSKQFTSLVNVSFLQKEELVFRIRLISEQIRQLEIELTELEERIDTFNRRYILELNPLIAAIINLKKKIYEKLKGLGLYDEEFEQLKADYEKVNAALEKEQEKDVPNLSENEQKDIKNMYHEASILCHPDSGKCVIEDKMKAAETFSSLSSAYKVSDFYKVKEIYDQLKQGHINPDSINNSDVELLKRKLATMEYKYEKTLNSIKYLKNTEPFITFDQISDWDEYFSVQKTVLNHQKEELELKYVKQ
jgi:hypothetical protein